MSCFRSVEKVYRLGTIHDSVASSYDLAVSLSDNFGVRVDELVFDSLRVSDLIFRLVGH